MKKTFPLVLLGLFVVSLFSITDARAQDEDPAKDARIRQLEAQVRELTAINEETRARVEEVVTYLNQRAADGQTMLLHVDQAEELGFVPGMNYPSREALIAGWRAYYGAAGRNLPRVGGTEEEKPEQRRR